MPRFALATVIAVVLVAAGCGGSTTKTSPPTTATRSASNSLLQGKTWLKVARIGSLPLAFSKAAAVALPHGRLMVLGGYTGAGSLDTILAGPPGRLRAIGHLPQPTHDAAAAVLGGSVYLFGGGESVSRPSVVRVDPRNGSATQAPSLGEPLSDLGAVAIGGHAYLVGGYTGTQFATAIFRYRPAATIARLPTGTRYAGVAAIGRTIYVAGGLTTAGATSAVYAVSLSGGLRRIATLPALEDHAGLAALGGRLYLVSGRRVLAIDPKSRKVTVAARLPVSLSDPTATTVGNQIIVTGGGTNGVWSLEPTT